MDNLEDSLADLRRGMERLTEAYISSVARMLDWELRTPIVDLAPSDRSEQCPGVSSAWEGVPGAIPAPMNDRQCPDNLAHSGPHTWWLDPSTGLRAKRAIMGTVKHNCPGLASSILG